MWGAYTLQLWLSHDCCECRGACMGPQPSWLQLASAQLTGILKVRACSLYSQLRGLAAETMGTLACGVISPTHPSPPSRESVWSVVSSKWDCLMVWQGRGCFGSLPSHVGRLGGMGLQGNARARSVVLAGLMKSESTASLSACDYLH